MDFIDKQHGILFLLGNQSGYISLLLNSRGGHSGDVHPHFIGDNGGQSGLAESRRTEQQHVIKRLPAFAGG